MLLGGLIVALGAEEKITRKIAHLFTAVSCCALAAIPPARSAEIAVVAVGGPLAARD
jgi:hypothetical protein